jgi:DNA polymerase V
MNARGGKRQGSGRRTGSGRYGEPTELMRIPKSMVTHVRTQIEHKNSFEGIPLYLSPVPAGSPNWLDDDIDEFIDLNTYLVRDQDQTFMVIAKGDSMIGANIMEGSALIVDRSIKPQDGDIVIASLDGEITVKRFSKSNKSISLKPENKKYKTILIDRSSLFSILGVVTFILNEAI